MEDGEQSNQNGGDSTTDRNTDEESDGIDLTQTLLAPKEDLFDLTAEQLLARDAIDRQLRFEAQREYLLVTEYHFELNHAPECQAYARATLKRYETELDEGKNVEDRLLQIPILRRIINGGHIQPLQSMDDIIREAMQFAHKKGMPFGSHMEDVCKAYWYSLTLFYQRKYLVPSISEKSYDNAEPLA